MSLSAVKGKTSEQQFKHAQQIRYNLVRMSKFSGITTETLEDAFLHQTMLTNVLKKLDIFCFNNNANYSRQVSVPQTAVVQQLLDLDYSIVNSHSTLKPAGQLFKLSETNFSQAFNNLTTLTQQFSPC